MEVIATIGLFSMMLFSLGAIFSQMQQSRIKMLAQLELMQLAQNQVFNEKQTIYRNPSRYILSQEKEESNRSSLQVGKYKVNSCIKIKRVKPRIKELSKTYLITLQSTLTNKDLSAVCYSEKVVITQHLLK